MPVVFISRGTMSGTQRLVNCLHERSGVRCISFEYLVKIVNRHGEIASRIVERLAKATTAYDQFSELRWPYIVLLRQAMLEEIRHDNIIYHGYSSHLILPPLHHFIRVRIEAPLNMRLAMTMQRLACDEEKARDYIREQDEYRVKWARFMYAQDIRKTMLYDLTLNMGHMTLEAACRIIENLMKEPDFRATTESQAEVDRLYFATTIEAALVADPRTASNEIRAIVDKQEGIRLIGPYLEEPELTAVIEIVKSVPGVDSIQYIPGYSPTLEMENPLKL